MLCATRVVLVRTTVTLPVEIVGENGTTASVTIQVPQRRVSEVRSLWMQIHNLSYANLASVQINASPWVSLNNTTVAVAEPGKSYGGIGGGFSTLSMALVLAGEYLIAAVDPVDLAGRQDAAFFDAFARVATRVTLGESERKTLDLQVVKVQR